MTLRTDVGAQGHTTAALARKSAARLRALRQLQRAYDAQAAEGRWMRARACAKDDEIRRLQKEVHALTHRPRPAFEWARVLVSRAADWFFVLTLLSLPVAGLIALGLVIRAHLR